MTVETKYLINPLFEIENPEPIYYFKKSMKFLEIGYKDWKEYLEIYSQLKNFSNEKHKKLEEKLSSKFKSSNRINEVKTKYLQ